MKQWKVKQENIKGNSRFRVGRLVGTGFRCSVCPSVVVEFWSQYVADRTPSNHCSNPPPPCREAIQMRVLYNLNSSLTNSLKSILFSAMK